MSNELAQDRRAWSASLRDVVNSVGDAGSTRPPPSRVNADESTSKKTLTTKQGSRISCLTRTGKGRG